MYTDPSVQKTNISLPLVSVASGYLWGMHQGRRHLTNDNIKQQTMFSVQRNSRALRI